MSQSSTTNTKRFPNEINALIIEQIENPRDIEVIGSIPELSELVKELYSLAYVTIASVQALESSCPVTKGLDGKRYGIYNTYEASFSETDTNYIQSLTNDVNRRIVGPNSNKFKNYKFIIYECHTMLDVGSELALILNMIARNGQLRHTPYSIKIFKPCLKDFQKPFTNKDDSLSVKFLDTTSYGIQFKHDDFKNRLQCDVFLEKYPNIRSLDFGDVQVKDLVDVSLKTIDVITWIDERGPSDPFFPIRERSSWKQLRPLDSYNGKCNKSFVNHKTSITDPDLFAKYVSSTRRSQGIDDSIKPSESQLMTYKKSYKLETADKEWTTSVLPMIKEIQSIHEYMTVSFRILHESSDWDYFQHQKLAIARLEHGNMTRSYNEQRFNGFISLAWMTRINTLAIAPVLVYPFIRMCINVYNAESWTAKAFWMFLIFGSHFFFFIDNYYLLLRNLSMPEGGNSLVGRSLRRLLGFKTTAMQ
ncbi:hypothetical protein WICPIJ_007147 [Wickerhamomyces pijperi]|uniref:Uncharacterized protein n=1 Tax=Wickerhamomyces pijperi TaxID=599730 RepID=A0A9P8Q2C8_WICPI|nr:hypothetical protein WICPIJ_007147 [Wickerhamomyces pijperi]